MSSKPHIAGSDRQLELANWVQQKWEEYGADHVTKTPYNVLLSYPNRTNPNKVRRCFSNSLDFTSVVHVYSCTYIYVRCDVSTQSMSITYFSWYYTCILCILGNNGIIQSLVFL